MTPTEEAIYRAGVLAERDAYAPVLNAERRVWFESVKCAITASDVAIGPIHPPAKSNVVQLDDFMPQDFAGFVHS